MSAEYAGFLGTYSLGGGYSFNEKHSLEFLIGTYNNGRAHYQSNLLYRYSRWSVPFKNRTWIPLQIGVFILQSWDHKNYFNKSPEPYPEENYYESTLIRSGLELGSTILVPEYNLGISYRYRMLDNGLVAIYNNTNRDLQYYTSSGLGLQYYF